MTRVATPSATGRILAAGVAAILAGAGWAQRPQGTIDGNLWLNSSTEVRKAFLVGAANMMALESAYAIKNGTPQPVASALATKALENLTLDQISSRLTNWYQANPHRRDLPVMGVIWLEMVAPAAATM